MKHKLLALALAAGAAFAPVAATAADFINLTPKPKQMTAGTGTLVLPSQFAISSTGLTAEMQAEITKFAAAFAHATGLTVTEGADGLFSVSHNADIAPEGYKLTVSADDVAIEASAAAGLYYAFQTVKKIAGANVAIGVAAPGQYELPCLTVNDEPRYPWRGMELDCARHFFSLDQLKKMVDIMAVYKMNRLHWHLTDDQGWRLEMPKYPKLTTAAAAPKNNYWWDFDNHKLFLTNEQYGPFFYTVDEMKELVAYAKERHIEICPEVDLPGHMQAAIAAYPEFSTTPDGEHPVRYWPGVSDDVLDVSNPAVVQFTKDIIDELAGIFPYEYIHIGGDECPTTAWANSPACQQFKKDYGLKSDRAIQNWLIKELADYARESHDRKLICWNEVITTSGADKEMIKNADIMIYSWLGGGTANNPSKQAAELGLRSVWCSSNHYYLDYPQWGGSDEPNSMGHVINLETVYNATPDYEAAKKELYYGVNCNLWTEYVCENKHLEYNALPRMIAVAETGWTPASRKNFNDFKARFNADTRLLDLGNYTYGRHYVDGSGQEAVMPEEGKYYRLITQASADAQRRDRCIELVGEGSDLIASLGATAGKLWTNTQAEAGTAAYDSQYWTFEADPQGSGKYAMVNRTATGGSVNPAMKGSSVNARWDYDYTAKHYNFVLGETFGTTAAGYTYSVRSDNGTDWYLNCAQAAQSLTVNNWNNPSDGNGGIWLFALEGAETAVDNPAFEPLTSGNYAFENGLGRGHLAVADALCVAPDHTYAKVGWTLTAGAYDAATNTQTITLRNMATGQYIAGLSENAVSTTAGIGFGGYANNCGFDVLLGDEPADITVTRSKENADEYILTIDGKNLFAFSATWENDPLGVNAFEGAPRKQGATWKIAAVSRAVCASTEAGGFYRYDLAGSEPAATLGIPACEPFDCFAYAGETIGEEKDGHLTATVEITRKFNKATYLCRDTEGTLWATVTENVPVGTDYEPKAPAFDWLQFERFDNPEGEWTFNAVYSTEAYKGIRALGEPVKEITAGMVYAIEDTHPDRHAFRGANGTIVGGSRTCEGLSPAYTWVLEANGNNFNVKNVGSGLYVQALKRSTAATLGETPYGFKFTYNTDHWSIKNSRNSMYWDGSENLQLVGWDGGTGHDHQLYTVAEADPFFRVAVEERDQDGELLASKASFVKPGDSYVFVAAARPGKALTDVKGNEGLDAINSNKTITVTYTVEKDAINELHADQRAGRTGIYDLQGRRLAKAGRPGVYIINGVKTLVK